jgi:two-component system phosphate regulon response regulator PhoB
MSKGTILVIDDEKDLVELVRFNLQREGYALLTATNGRDGLEMARRHRPELAILDVMMPGADGLEICRALRADARTSDIAVIMLTAKVSEADRVVGLELGADDYVTKPFSPRELVARVKAILRRAAPSQPQAKAIRVGPLEIDPERHEVKVDDQLVELTATEFRILQLLFTRRGMVCSRQQIIDGALGHDAIVTSRIVDVHVTALRRKLGKAGNHLQTVRGFGYKLTDQAEETLASA